MPDVPANAPLLSSGSTANIKNLFRLIIISVVLLGMFLQNLSEQNAKTFWKTIERITPSDIEKIEIQNYQSNKEIGNPIVITDRVTITDFVTAVKTIQEFGSNHEHFGSGTIIKIFIIDNEAFDLITNKRTLEFKCYFLPNAGETVFVREMKVKPGIFTSGSGYARFAGSVFYDWLSSAGGVLN